MLLESISFSQFKWHLSDRHISAGSCLRILHRHCSTGTCLGVVHLYGGVQPNLREAITFRRPHLDWDVTLHALSNMHRDTDRYESYSPDFFNHICENKLPSIPQNMLSLHTV